MIVAAVWKSLLAAAFCRASARALLGMMSRSLRRRRRAATGGSCSRTASWASWYRRREDIADLCAVCCMVPVAPITCDAGGSRGVRDPMFRMKSGWSVILRKSFSAWERPSLLVESAQSASAESLARESSGLPCTLRP